MEGYRNYPESSYSSDPPSPEPRGYEQYDQHPSPYEYDAAQYDSPRYDPPRPDPGRPDPGRPEPARMPPRPGPPAGPARPGPLPGEEPSLSRRPSVPAPGSPGPAGDGVYRSHRPAAAVLVGLPAALLEIPALLLLYNAAFDQSASGVISASCLILALPLLALGLYAVATGAVRAAGPNSVQAWLRPPVAYLSVALVLFLAAGLAA